MFENILLLLIAIAGAFGVNAAYEVHLPVLAIVSGLVTVVAVYGMGVRSGDR